MILKDRVVSTAARSRKLLMSSLSALALQQRLSGGPLVHRTGRAPSRKSPARGMPANFCKADMQGIPLAGRVPNCIRTGGPETSNWENLLRTHAIDFV